MRDGSSLPFRLTRAHIPGKSAAGGQRAEGRKGRNFKVHRSYLYAPGHSPKITARVFERGADAVILDLEDSVPESAKGEAREAVARILTEHTAFVRINAVRSDTARADLDAIAELTRDIKIPKVESPDDVIWVKERVRDARLHCIIETARGILAAAEIAATPGVADLSIGAVDLAQDLRCPGTWNSLVTARSIVVLASSASGLEPPHDSAYPQIADISGLEVECVLARELGFHGKVAIHPAQVDVINKVFAPTADELAWAREVIQVFEAAAGSAAKTSSGALVDVPVALRARQILDMERTSE